MHACYNLHVLYSTCTYIIATWSGLEDSNHNNIAIYIATCVAVHVLCKFVYTYCAWWPWFMSIRQLYNSHTLVFNLCYIGIVPLIFKGLPTGAD